MCQPTVGYLQGVAHPALQEFSEQEAGMQVAQPPAEQLFVQPFPEQLVLQVRQLAASVALEMTHITVLTSCSATPPVQTTTGESPEQSQ